VGGPRAGDTGGGSSGSPKWVRIFRIGPGSRTGSPQQPEVAKSAKARDGFALGKQSERDQPDVAAACWALERKLLPHPGHQLGPGNPGGVVRAWLLIRIRVTAAPRRATVVPIPTGRGLALLADVADRECRDGFSQPVIGRKHPVVAMPVLPRRRDEIGQPVEELKRREFDDAIGSRPHGLPPTTPPDPVGGLVSREHVADSGCAAVWAADHGEPFKREWRPSAVSEKVLKRLTLDTHLGR